MVSIRTAYSPPVKVQIDFPNPSLTVQAAKDECDINKILKKYMRTRLMDHVNANQGVYDDFTSVQDYHTSIEQVRRADEMFASLPSGLRNRFKNDPAEFLAFVGNSENRDEAISLGLIPRPADWIDPSRRPENASNEEAEKAAE